MKAASLHDIKQELMALPPKTVLEVCLRLARFKKENKELLHYLLFEAHNQQGYIDSIKAEINDAFWNMPRGNMYIIKKALRKILRLMGKYTKHFQNKKSEVELIIHFCQNMKTADIPFRHNRALSNIYDQQLKKIGVLIEQVHEDLRFDYKKQFTALAEGAF